MPEWKQTENESKVRAWVQVDYQTDKLAYHDGLNMLMFKTHCKSCDKEISCHLKRVRSNSHLTSWAAPAREDKAFKRKMRRWSQMLSEIPLKNHPSSEMQDRGSTSNKDKTVVMQCNLNCTSWVTLKSWIWEQSNTHAKRVKSTSADQLLIDAYWLAAQTGFFHAHAQGETQSMLDSHRGPPFTASWMAWQRLISRELQLLDSWDLCPVKMTTTSCVNQLLVTSGGTG